MHAASLAASSPRGSCSERGARGSEGGWKEAASVNFLGCGGCGSGVCTWLCSPPLGREGAELGVAARVVPSSSVLSGAEPSAVAAARRELSRIPRRECGWRGWAGLPELDCRSSAAPGVGESRHGGWGQGRVQVSTVMLGSLC